MNPEESTMTVLLMSMGLLSSCVMGDLEGVSPFAAVRHPQLKSIARGEADQITTRPAKVNIATGFGYSTNDDSNHFRQEHRDGDGVVRGTYGYKTPSGIMRLVHYVSDNNGFRASIASNEPGIAQLNPSHVTVEKFPPESAHFEHRLDSGFRTNAQRHPLGSRWQIARASAGNAAKRPLGTKQPHYISPIDPVWYDTLARQPSEPHYGALANRRILPNGQLESTSLSLGNRKRHFNVPNEGKHHDDRSESAVHARDRVPAFDSIPPPVGVKAETTHTVKDPKENFHFPVDNNHSEPGVPSVKCHRRCGDESKSLDSLHLVRNGESVKVDQLFGGGDEGSKQSNPLEQFLPPGFSRESYDVRRGSAEQNRQQTDENSVVHLAFAKKLLELSGLDGVIPPYLLPKTMSPAPGDNHKPTSYVLQRLFPKTGTRWRVQSDEPCYVRSTNLRNGEVSSNSMHINPNSFHYKVPSQFQGYSHVRQSEVKGMNELMETFESEYFHSSETPTLGEPHPESLKKGSQFLGAQKNAFQSFRIPAYPNYQKSGEQALTGYGSRLVPNEGHTTNYFTDNNKRNESEVSSDYSLTNENVSLEQSKSVASNSSVRSELPPMKTFQGTAPTTHDEKLPLTTPAVTQTKANNSTAYKLHAHLNERIPIRDDWEQGRRRVAILKPLRYPTVVSTLPEYLQVPPLSDSEFGNHRFFKIPGTQRPLYDSRGVLIKPENVPVHLHRFTPIRGSPFSSKSTTWRFAIPKPVLPTSVVIPPKPQVLF